MQTTPAPHEGLGVAQYAWSTSPLRRYVDLVNQWQLIACVQHGVTAKLAAPFKRAGGGDQLEVEFLGLGLGALTHLDEERGLSRTVMRPTVTSCA